MDRVKAPPRQNRKQRRKSANLAVVPSLNTIRDLLTDLFEIGITVTSKDGRVCMRGNQGAYTPELRERVLAIKPDLLAYLQPRERADNLPEIRFKNWRGLDTSHEAWEEAIAGMLDRAGLRHDHQETMELDTPMTDEEETIIRLLEDYGAHLQPERCHHCGCRVYAATWWRLRKQWSYDDYCMVPVNAGTPSCVRCFRRRLPKPADYEPIADELDVPTLPALQTMLDEAWALILALPRGRRALL